MPDAASPSPLWLGSPDPDGTGTAVVLAPVADALPTVAWLGAIRPGLDGPECGADLLATVGTATAPSSSQSTTGRAVPLLPEVSRSWLGRPALSGYRLGGAVPAGTDWSSRFAARSVSATDDAVRVEAADPLSGLELLSEIEAVPGGGVRLRHTLTNSGAGVYVVDALDVVVPVADHATEILDLTGRWAAERTPQRHPVRTGVWLREGRGGRSGLDAATMVVAGTEGFGFGSGEVWGIHLAWSGNTRHYVERQPSGLVTMGGGELLLPGELTLEPGESYATPWLHVTSSLAGLDGLAAQMHGYLRSLPAHPRSPAPVVCNVWEAVYFDHDLGRLTELAQAAAGIGIERFVLDDGWFGSRRDDHSGLGDWVVSADAWPDGLGPLIDRVRALGMEFGLWFEPEMVNPDSDLYRAHPDWILNVSGREPGTLRNQLVLDLGRPEVRDHLFGQLDDVLSTYDIGFVKWDHNRLLVDAGSAARGSAPGVHAQTLGFYDLLDRLRAAHPGVEWESCASGGGRIDVGVLTRTQRVWTSDMTDALARQTIQRWTAQLVPAEYLGAHVSAPTNHQTGRQFSLDFRAATAFFGDFGVEWDVTSATPEERRQLARWISAYRQLRPLLHSGRMVRVDTAEPDIWIHGVVGQDRSEAVFAYVQLDEFVRDPVPFRVRGLDRDRRYTARQVVPATTTVDEHYAGGSWRGEGMTLTGAVLEAVGLPPAPRGPLSAVVIHLVAE